MIKISENFITDNKKLAALYEGARGVLLDAVKPFGDTELATLGDADVFSASSEVMSAETLARYDMQKSLECVKALIKTQREDGRMASAILKNGDGIFCDYSKLAGFSFVEEALSIFYMTKKKELTFVEEIYAAFERFDDYLWSTHDKNLNGCLELLDPKETVEGCAAARYSSSDGESSPFPVELAALLGFAYRLKLTLGDISDCIGDGKADIYYSEAQNILEKITERFWDGEKHAFYDRDGSGELMSALTLDNMLLLYYGAVEKEFADEVVRRHILDCEKFFGALPLPTLAMNDPAFLSDREKPFGGLVRGDSYRRAVRAFEKYGYYSEFTSLARRFLAAVSKSGEFCELYDPQSGAPREGLGCREYAPTASAVLETVARLCGVSVVFDSVHWGALGHEGECSSEYNFKWGGDTYTVLAEKDTTMGLINGKLVFTVTNGVRVITDWFGDNARVVNITDRVRDCVFVYRDKTFSFSIGPNEVKQF